MSIQCNKGGLRKIVDSNLTLHDLQQCVHMHSQVCSVVKAKLVTMISFRECHQVGFRQEEQ